MLPKDVPSPRVPIDGEFRSGETQQLRSETQEKR